MKQYTRAQLQHAIADQWSTRSYRIEYGGYLSNHLLHGVVALFDLGAPATQVDSFAASYAKTLVPVESANYQNGRSVLTLDEALPLLGKRVRFEDLADMYEREIAVLGRDGAVRQHLPRLVGGLAGSLLHGIIQLGYAYHVGVDRCVAEGLAYLHHSYLSFDRHDVAPEQRSEADKTTSGLNEAAAATFRRSDAFQLVHALAKDEFLLEEQQQRLQIEAISNRTTSNLQRKLMAMCAHPELGSGPAFQKIDSVLRQYDFDAVDGDVAVDFALWLFVLVPSCDFVLVHAVTSAWALQQVEHLLSPSDRARAWRTWFQMAASVVVMRQFQALPDTDTVKMDNGKMLEWEDLIARTLSLDEPELHVYKVVQVAHAHAMKTRNGPSAHTKALEFLTPLERSVIAQLAASKVITDECVI
ncbi:TPA: hypothetical protein N0F65_009452 [Lagenidium giganteum]|uniref:Uncharacterized protein n=1 Tax=Lagenidium giganteum TaxID=4803 RepID=A0AAV2ZFX9_9STRA|nr:TPA: hypothetical protein N0F65_009452 [Lagenidium giganteum]